MNNMKGHYLFSYSCTYGCMNVTVHPKTDERFTEPGFRWQSNQEADSLVG